MISLVVVTEDQHNMYSIVPVSSKLVNTAEAKRMFEAFTSEATDRIFDLTPFTKENVRQLLGEVLTETYTVESSSKTDRIYLPSAYVLWCNANRDSVVSDMPVSDRKVSLVGKRLGEVWRGLTDEERQVYIDKHSELKRQLSEGSYIRSPPKKRVRSKQPAPVASSAES